MFNKYKQIKKTISPLSLILLLAMSLMVPLIQPSLAQVGQTQPRVTAGYIDVAPSLIGVGQKATVNLWVFPTPENYVHLPHFEGYSGVTVTFIKPDGTKDTFEPIDATGQFAAGQTESIGAIFFYYEPDMAGNWSVSFTMPAQNITDSYGTSQYTTCTSKPDYFTVQTDPVNAGLLNGYPWGELPNESTYWDYPINSNNRDWNQISGDWLSIGNVKFNYINGIGSNGWQPYGSAPNTGHIVWKQEHWPGGIVGGDYGSISYSPGLYSMIADGPAIIAGKAYINIPNTNEFKCIDLTTGEVLYKMTGQIISGIHEPGNPYYQNTAAGNQVVLSSSSTSPTSYLFGTSGSDWNFYDPLTGTLKISIKNATAGASTATMNTVGYRLVDGTPLAYGISGDFSFLFGWNMSKVVNNNWQSGITWTTPLWIKPYFATNGRSSVVPNIMGISIDASTIVVSGARSGTNQLAGYSTKDGTSIWNLTLPYTVSGIVSLYGTNANAFLVFDAVEAKFHCYSMLTGAEIWTSPSFSDSPWASWYSLYSSETNDDSNVYIMFPDGIIRALDLKTGDLVWESKPIASTEYINNAVPYYCGIILAGGNIYAYAGYSSLYEIDPIPRLGMLVCVNATTGDFMYTLNGGIQPKAAANGYVVGIGRYDGNLYCIGKGQTSTSVIIQNNVVANHATALITGNVLDQSPAQEGTPAVADSSMSEWMDYLNMQNATLLNNPPKPEGVPVTITAIDPNGNTIEIGTTTTDFQGNYGISFDPTISGMYTIIATFAGSDSYWPSTSGTKLTVLEAPQPSATSTPISFDVVNNTIMTGLVVVGIAIIIAIAVAIVLLRKRP